MKFNSHRWAVSAAVLASLLVFVPGLFGQRGSIGHLSRNGASASSQLDQLKHELQQLRKSGTRTAAAATSATPGKTNNFRPQSWIPNNFTGWGSRPSLLKSAQVGPAVNFPGFLGADPFVTVASQPYRASTWASLTVDVDKDGRPDIVNIQNDGTLNVAINPHSGILSDMTVTFTDTSAVSDTTLIGSAMAEDLNGDGYPDIVASDFESYRAFVYNNRGNGTFAPAVTYSLEFTVSLNDIWYHTGDIVVGDVTGDGVPDLVALSTDPYYPDWNTTTVEVLTYPGRGDGTFGPLIASSRTTFDGLLITSYNQIALADVDQDGFRDLVFPCDGMNNDWVEGVFLAVGKNNLAGGFTGLPTVLPPAGSFLEQQWEVSSGGIYVGDVDSDQLPDVLFAFGNSGVFLARGAAAGGLTLPTAQITGLQFPDIINFADVTGDGNVDVVAYYSGSIEVYAGEGGGSFSSTPLIQLASGAGGDQQPMPADFNGDGKADLVRVDYSLNRAGFYLNTNGTFYGSPILVPKGDDNEGKHFYEQFQAIAAADFNNDGIDDILATEVPYPWEKRPNLKIGIADGHGNFTYSLALSGSELYGSDVQDLQYTPVDLNGDGALDLVMSHYWGIAVAYNNGDNTFAQPHLVPLYSLGVDPDIGCRTAYFDVGDVNGDGRTDIVVAYPGDDSCGAYFMNWGPGFFTLLNNGDGTFTPSFTQYGHVPYLPELIDFNNDGVLDVALAGSDSNNRLFGFYIFPGLGDGTFSVQNVAQPIRDQWVWAIIPCDYDGDGKQDLTVGVYTQVDTVGFPIYNTSGIEILKGRGDFTFDMPKWYAPGIAILDGKYADFNGDGKPDLALNVVQNGLYPEVQSSGFAYLPNLGDGLFGELRQVFATGGEQASGHVFVGDFNGDGAIDAINAAVSESYTSYGTHLWLNSGAVTLALSAEPSPAEELSPMTLTATVIPAHSAKQPGGNVVFYDNGTRMDSVPVAAGTASLTLSTLAVGAHAITAEYSGDPNFNAAVASTPLSVTVNTLPPSFQLGTPDQSTLTVTQGSTGSINIPVAANATFNGTVQLSCSGAPSLSACNVYPTSLTLSAGQTATAAVVITTTYQGNQLATARPSGIWGSAAGSLIFAVGFLFMVPGVRRKTVVKTSTLLLMLAIGSLSMLAGCGDDKKVENSTPVGTSTLTVTATSGSITSTQTFTVTVNAR